MAILVKPRSNKQGLVDATSDLANIVGRENYTVIVKDYGVFEWLPTGTANSVDIFAGSSGVWSLITSSAPAGNVAVKTYRALVTQSSGTAPTATVLENSLGGTVVWARSSTGTYTATLTGAFTSAKTFIMQPGETGTIAAIKNVLAVRTSDNVVTVTTGAGGTLEDSVLSSFPIEILVYP
jgi:hypothetical protein